MKRIGHIFSCAMLLMASTLEAKQVALFTSNAGQEHNRSLAQADRVLYTYSSNATKLFFRQGGYSVVQQVFDSTAHVWNTSRTDIDFVNGSSSMPVATVEAGNAIKIYKGAEEFSAQEFRVLTYSDVAPGISLRFFINNDGALAQCFLQTRDAANATSNVPNALAKWNNGFSQGYFSLYDITSIQLNTGSINFRPEIITCYVASPLYRAASRLAYPSEHVLTASFITFAGGINSDDLWDVKICPNGDLIVVGSSGSTNFPIGVGTIQDTLNAAYDAVILRLDTLGNRVWGTYFGSNGYDVANQIAMVGSDIYVCGQSNGTDLPVANAWQSTIGGSYDAFLLKLTGAGQRVWATYYGGSIGENGIGLVADAFGHLYLGGSSSSPNLPLASTGWQTTNGGAIDMFLTKFDTSGVPHWATYYGGSSGEDIHAVALGPNNTIVTCGGTYSPNFPISANAWQQGSTGTPDIYLTIFDSSGTRLYASFYGGTNPEDAYGLAVAPDGRIYIAGMTYSLDFPITGTTYQNMLAGMNDVCVMCIAPNGTPIWSTYVGGVDADFTYDLELKGQYLYICGNTVSNDFPVSSNAWQNTNAGNTDGFLFKMDTTGVMVGGTFIGGGFFDSNNALIIDADTNAIIAGSTNGSGFPVTQGAMQTVYGGVGDGFVAVLDASWQLLGNGSTPATPFSNTPILIENPVHDQIRIQLPDGKSIRRVLVYDAQGRVCATTTAATIAIQQWANGVYFLVVEDEQGRVYYQKVSVIATK